MGNKLKDNKSLTSCNLFPQPLFKMAEYEDEEKLMLMQNFYNAANLSRMPPV
jgi:hypothetical protein